MKFAIFFSLFVYVTSLKYSCYVRTYFAKLCYQFDFEGSCQPWQLEECQPIRVTTMDYHCPRYFCVSSCFKILTQPFCLEWISGLILLRSQTPQFSLPLIHSLHRSFIGVLIKGFCQLANSSHDQKLKLKRFRYH